jgi:hypothetical protein
MLRPCDAVLLQPLLEPGHAIETSLVAVKMLGRIHEAQPPSTVDQYPQLATHARQIAEALLNPYVIASSQSAALAQLTVYALAAMASSDVLRIVNTVRGLGHSWFAQQMAFKLRELRKYWSDAPTPVAAGPRELLERASRELSAN